MVAAGAAAHSDHGRAVAEVFMSVARKETGDYRIKDPQKLLSIAPYLGVDIKVEVDGEELDRDLVTAAMRAYTGVGCSGYARVDFRVDDHNRYYCLEINTLPGMTATSLVPKAARAAGLGFAELLERIVELSLEDGEAEYQGADRQGGNRE
jgi:hypothetical protein